MKKYLALLLALTLAFVQAFAAAEEAAEPEEPAPRIPEGAVVHSHLSVGNPTPMRGEFFTDMWGNDTSDIDVRDLLHGYNLIRWDGEFGRFTTDPSVVSDTLVMLNDAGDHVYVLTLCDDLYYSDGTRITARDYAFAWLLAMSPAIAEIGGLPQRLEHIAGYQAYLDGTADVLSGVKVLGDNVLMVTIDHDYLPFFYEMGLLSCQPCPISVIAPGLSVRDDGAGVYLDGELSAALLRYTILDPATGYQSHPAVVCGPYTLTSWDGVTAEFAINPYYKGNAEGVKPVIETLSFTTADNETMMDLLENGTFGLLDKVTRADNINRGLASMGENGLAMSSYPRIGLSYISFACEKPAMASQAVRQAIAWCMDRDQVTADYVGDFGQRVDGLYGIGQWMYSVVTGAIEPPVEMPENENDAKAMADYEAALAEYEALNLDGLTQYTLDPGRAAALLDEDGWTLNADGVREKVIDGQTVTLDLKLTYPEGNNVNEIFAERLVPNLEAVGIRLTMTAVPMQELLTRWYKQGPRDEDMIYLGSNFHLLFDPAVQFVPNGEGGFNWSFTNHTDEELYERAIAMRRTEPGDVLTYLKNWLAFQERFNETLPMLPVYGNIYFDFFTENLHDYQIPAAVTWGEAIVSAALYEAPPEAAAEEGEDLSIDE